MLVFRMGFLSRDKISKLKLKNFGSEVLISENASILHPELVSIGDNSRIDDFVVISGKVSIGSHVHIGTHCSLLASSQEIILEDFSGISPGCRIFAASDDFSGDSLTNPTIPNEFTKVNYSRVVLKKHVIVGSNSVIGPGVTLNEGAAIGALSLVRLDVEAWTINAGVPARKIRERAKTLLQFESFLGDIKKS